MTQSPLGKGLQSLIPPKPSKLAVLKEKIFTPPPTEGGARKKGLPKEGMFLVNTEEISPNPYQPRQSLSQDSLKDLIFSIKEQGILQPLVASKTPDGRYQLIVGHRRLEAAKIAGLKEVPVIIRESIGKDYLELALMENIQRDDLNPVEKALAFEKLVKKFKLSHKEIAKRIGKSRAAVTNTLRLLELPVEIQRGLLRGTLSEGHARVILGLKNSQKQLAFYKAIIKNSLSVREAEAKLAQISVRSHKRRRRAVDPETRDLEERLQEALGTKVIIKKRGKSGRIVIEFYSGEEMEGIVDRLLGSKIENS